LALSCFAVAAAVANVDLTAIAATHTTTKKIKLLIFRAQKLFLRPFLFLEI
jgi:hypothetical protein